MLDRFDGVGGRRRTGAALAIVLSIVCVGIVVGGGHRNTCPRYERVPAVTKVPLYMIVFSPPRAKGAPSSYAELCSRGVLERPAAHITHRSAVRLS